ncbi:MAG: MBL fold metallo-hydrolase [Sulfuricella sp.]|nr:MBL fold metallo-hydrolase [Sulfuricella sp.]
MRFASLGSGSRGNALVVEAGRTSVMLDCGFGINETVLRLSRLDLQPTDLSAILVTHEHTDHVGGVARVARKFNLPVWMTHGTFKGLGENSLSGVALNLIDDHSQFIIGDLHIQPYPVPHDAREPAQYVFGDGARRLGVLTDAGAATPHIEEVLAGCEALVLESNHDAVMLQNGPYPPMLKKRVAGRFGHLDNQAAAQLLARLVHGKLQHVVAAHLSEKNNTEELVLEAFCEVLNCAREWVGIAAQDGGLGWRHIN